MEAGYDYLLINRRSRMTRRMLPLVAATVVVLGLVGVLVWSLFAFVFDGSPEEPESVVSAVSPTPTPQPTTAPAGQTPTPVPTVVAVAPPQPVAPPPPATPVPALPSDLARVVGLYPGASIKAGDWADLLGARGPITLIEEVIWEPAPVVAVGQLPPPVRLIIPSIDVDASVQQLTIANNVIDPPQNAVGHIPTTANPGEAGSVWLIGHLESPIRGEGNVFAQLPELPSKLRGFERQDVFAVIENGTDSYRYRLLDSQVIPQDVFTIEYLTLRDDGSGQLFMVTAVPRGIYDQRLVVRGVLDGVRS